MRQENQIPDSDLADNIKRKFLEKKIKMVRTNCFVDDIVIFIAPDCYYL